MDDVPVSVEDIRNSACKVTVDDGGVEGEESKHVTNQPPVDLWDTKVKVVNPVTDLVLSPYPMWPGSSFCARISLPNEIGVDIFY